MTLHWWMHWFWITCHFTFCILLTHSKPLSPLTTTVPSELDTIQNRPLHRPAKSIDQPVTKPQASITVPFPATSDTSDLTVFGEPLSQLSKTTETPDKSPCSNSNNSSLKNNTLCNNNITVNPLNLTTTVTNMSLTDTTLSNFDENVTTDSMKDNNSNSTLTSVIVTKELVSSVKIAESDHISSSSSSDSSLTAVSITGISFGVLVFATFVGVTTFILYRRRYLNKPQTLNDKCSNPDSSGYIDDSTMRENSEEMYSLDNDSFLNSLEAMTIQNYWTDSVKHTKL